jgi:hypothetical protein
MPLSMHSASAPIFVRTLNNMSAWLDKAEQHATEKGFDPDNYLGLRFTPDMLPFVRQIQIATDASKNCLARLAGVEPPKWADDEATFDDLRPRIQKAIDYAGSMSAEQVDGSESREIVLPLGPDRSMTFTGELFLTGFALPNFFFHATTTYALLRQAGVELGKMDYLGAP